MSAKPDPIETPATDAPSDRFPRLRPVYSAPSPVPNDAVAAAPCSPDADLNRLVPGATMQEVERVVILKTLDAVGGSTSRAAAVLGISRRKIQYRLKGWGMTGRDFADAPSPHRSQPRGSDVCES